MESIRKFREKKQELISSQLDTDTQSFLYSLIFHVFILLIASFIIAVEAPEKHIVLKLNFGPEHVEEIDTESKFVELETSTESENETPEPLIQEVVAVEEDPAIHNLEYVSLDNTNAPPITDDLPPLETNLNDIFQEENTNHQMVTETRQINHMTNTSIVQQIAGSIVSGESNAITGPAILSQLPGSSIDQRLASAGAKTGDVQISMSWNTIDDIDLHVGFTPGNGLVDNINWMNRIGRLSSGMLDIDMNADSAFLSNQPVENIFWPPNSSPFGHFVVYVHFYRSWTGNKKVPVLVRIKQKGLTQDYQVVALLYSKPQEVARFNYFLKK